MGNCMIGVFVLRNSFDMRPLSGLSRIKKIEFSEKLKPITVQVSQMPQMKFSGHSVLVKWMKLSFEKAYTSPVVTVCPNPDSTCFVSTHIFSTMFISSLRSRIT